MIRLLKLQEGGVKRVQLLLIETSILWVHPRPRAGRPQPLRRDRGLGSLANASRNAFRPSAIHLLTLVNRPLCVPRTPCFCHRWRCHPDLTRRCCFHAKGGARCSAAKAPLCGEGGYPVSPRVRITCPPLLVHRSCSPRLPQADAIRPGAAGSCPASRRKGDLRHRAPAGRPVGVPSTSPIPISARERRRLP